MPNIDHTNRIPKLFVVALTVTFLAMSATSCSDRNEKNKAEDDSSISKPNVPIDFVIGDTNIIAGVQSSEDKAAEIDVIKEVQSDKIAELVQQYFEVAFLKPALWEEGEFSKLDSYFLPSIRDQVRGSDFKALCLGSDAKQIAYLKSLDAKIPSIWINIDDSLKPQLAVATAEVEADFIQKDSKTANLKTSATLIFEPTTDNQWQISDYDLKYTLNSEEK